MRTDQIEARLAQEVEDLLATTPPGEVSDEEFWGAQFDRGLAWIDFPEGLGGLGLDPKYQAIVTDRLRDAGAPDNVLRNLMGVGMAGPTLIGHGTDAQRQRLLRPIFTCEEIWCQLFSEPDAGSDLAGLRTRAERTEDGWRVTGQKVWTSLAHMARWGLLLARTDATVPKHRGLSYFILDMHQPGVDVRPLRQLTGEAEFNEVYFDDAIVPVDMMIGAPGAGWRVAMTTLMNERAALGRLGDMPRGGGPIAHAVKAWKAHGVGGPVARDELTRLWIEAEALRLTAIRADEERQIGATGASAAVGKIAQTVNHQSIYDFVTHLRGSDALLIDDYKMRRPTSLGTYLLGDEDPDLTKAFLESRASSIGGGTTQIAKNVLAERVLGLPPEPRADKDVPFDSLPR